MDGKEISLFVRDEQNGRFLFNAKALQALGFSLVSKLSNKLRTSSAVSTSLNGRPLVLPPSTDIPVAEPPRD